MKLLVTALVAAAGLAGPAQAAQPAACDRACLRQALDQFLTAVVRRDLSAAGLAPAFRQTENVTETKAGEGVWKTATGLGKVQRRYFDPVSGQAAYFGLVEEAGARPAVVSLRIKVAGGKVAEAEWIVAREGAVVWSPEGLEKIPPHPDTPLPASERLSREALLKVGESYFDGVAAHNGAVVIANKGCQRIENGTVTTNWPLPRPGAALVAPSPPPTVPIQPNGQPAPAPAGFTDCTSGFERLVNEIKDVVGRRFPVIDTEAGVAMGVGIFTRPDTPFRRADGSVVPRLLLAEFFEVSGGKIQTIHAAMNYLPADAPERTGW